MMIELLILVVGIAILVALGAVAWKLHQAPNAAWYQNFNQQFQTQQQQRHQESESLRQEIRDTTKSLQTQFFQVNQTVNQRLDESSKQLNSRLDQAATAIREVSRQSEEFSKQSASMNRVAERIEHLDRLLRAPKKRGSLGEEALEELLRAVLPDQKLWERQYRISAEKVVDIAIKTSGGIIPVDAKFPMPAFESLLQAQTDEARANAEKQLHRDLKKRIEEVAKYVDPAAGTFDFAIMFLPNENLYYEAVIGRQEINDFAKQKQVLITGPNTMLYVLQILLQAYQSQNFAQQAREALLQLKGVQQQAQVLDVSLGKLANHLGNAQNQLGESQKNNSKLQSKVEQVTQLDQVPKETLSESSLLGNL